MKEDGSTLSEIREALGMAHSAICDAWKAYQEGGEAALKTGQRGRRLGEQRHLSIDQEKKVRRKIIDRLPEQLKLDFALWTRDAVRQLIAHETGIEMPVRTVGEYLKRWGFTPQKPLKFAYERKPELVKKWLEADYPQICTKAKLEKAEIYWGDETGLRSGDVRGVASRYLFQSPPAFISSEQRENTGRIPTSTARKTNRANTESRHFGQPGGDKKGRESARDSQPERRASERRDNQRLLTRSSEV